MLYRDFNDYELLDYVKENNEDANKIIFKKYEPLIMQNASRLLKYSKYCGLEHNDLIQEGYIALDTAIKTFSDSKSATFYTYAKTCIERRQLTAVIASGRQKHKLLNESISLDGLLTNENDQIPSDRFFADTKSDPETIVEDSEEEKELRNKIKKLLTPFELQVFDLKVAGYSYAEISGILNKNTKAIDNAIQRIKLKIKDLK